SLGCATTGSPPPKTQATQLQIREFQTRNYDTNDTKMVMKAVLNVLQDDGFIIKNSDSDLNFLNAVREVDVENKGKKFWAQFWWGPWGHWEKNAVIDCTANISLFGTQSRVRLNFQMKRLNNKGEIIEVKPLEDPQFYQEFFSKVDKGIFIQKEKL
ncbi:MAG: hypothetical protein HY540_02600, partial [Deltaproteobacteria bacterium]|nr:hypothetical protein [Deltaproteobacteria bacterium]